jgi:hypothetical protein
MSLLLSILSSSRTTCSGWKYIQGVAFTDCITFFNMAFSYSLIEILHCYQPVPRRLIMLMKWFRYPECKRCFFIINFVFFTRFPTNLSVCEDRTGRMPLYRKNKVTGDENKFIPGMLGTSRTDFTILLALQVYSVRTFGIHKQCHFSFVVACFKQHTQPACLFFSFLP